MSDETTPAPAVADAPVVLDAPAGHQPETTPETEPKTEAKVEAPEPEGDDDEGGDRKRLSRNQRLSRKAALLAAENAELRRLAEEGRRTDDRPARQEADDEKPPKEADFNGDYLAYERALNAYNTGKAVRDAVRKEVADARTREQKQRYAEARQEAVVAHMERIDEARERITDFDQVLKTGGQVPVAQQVADEILDSEKSALLQYYLAQNPDKLKELNQMSGRELAREIGRLEGRVHLPKAKKVTEATPPLSEVKGGAAPAFNPYKPDGSDDWMDKYVKWRAANG